MAPYRPLAGVRVLAFEVAVSLPAGTRILADLGAEVVQVRRPQPEQDAFIVTNYDGSLLNKASVALDLSKSDARAVALRLCAAADAVCINFRPGVLDRFGITRNAIFEIQPEQIVLQLSGYGTPGPWSTFPVFGHSVEAAGGMNALIGEPDDQPVQVGSRVLADQMSGKYAAVALIAALLHRRRTGYGQYIDLSMYESIIHSMGDLLLRTAATGTPPERTANRDPRYAPQGVYPCQGDDEWLALTVASDDEWSALRALLADPRLDAPEYSALAGRWAAHDAIDTTIADWTRTRTKEEAAGLLQQHGIAAGPVARPSDIHADPQHGHRGFFQRVRHAHSVLGYLAHPHPSLAVQVEGYDRPPLAESRIAGADNHRILQDWGGYSAEEIAALEQARVLIPPPPEARGTAAPPKGGFGGRPGVKDPDFARKLGLPAAEEVRA